MTGRKVALTAMHVIPGIDEYPSNSHPELIQFESPCVNGNGPIVGKLLRGTLNGIDAALIDIEGQVVSNYLQGIGPVDFWRSISSADENQPVRMVGAVSGKQYGRIVRAGVPAPGWNLSSALLVEIAAQRGDSGAPLVDENDRLIGMLVGGTSTRQLFCPIELVFDRLTCTLFKS
jgi:hypothetical protein